MKLRLRLAASSMSSDLTAGTDTGRLGGDVHEMVCIGFRDARAVREKTNIVVDCGWSVGR